MIAHFLGETTGISERIKLRLEVDRGVTTTALRKLERECEEGSGCACSKWKEDSRRGQGSKIIINYGYWSSNIDW